MDDLKTAAKKLRLPLASTPEDLACDWRHVIGFGEYTLLAGYHYMGLNNPSWFGAVYYFCTQNKNVDDPIKLQKISKERFVDEGHAIQWCLSQT